MKTVIVGASSGLGRYLGVALSRRGARVALLARRRSRLAAAAAEAANDAVAVACDVTDEKSCQEAIEKAASELGGIDAMVYASAVGPLGQLRDLDARTWRRAFDTNVIGAALTTAAALPYLSESRGTAAYISSVSANHTPPWPGLGAYVVSKAALEKLVEAWRAEHPDVGFTRIVVGSCAPGAGDNLTNFVDTWDQELAADLHGRWVAMGLMTGSFLDLDDVAGVVDQVLRCGASASIPSVLMLPREPSPAAGPVIGS